MRFKWSDSLVQENRQFEDRSTNDTELQLYAVNVYSEWLCVRVCVCVKCYRPVSAYALFFRDTQAAIKCQNPTASFGEMSKIVAAMWDTLDDMHKNVSDRSTRDAYKHLVLGNLVFMPPSA